MGSTRNNIRGICQKLITAIEHGYGRRITFHTQQFVGSEGYRHTLYILKEAMWDEDKRKYINHDLFRSASTIQVALYLRDFYYTLEGKELPTDNETWNQIRANINGQGDN